MSCSAQSVRHTLGGLHEFIVRFPTNLLLLQTGRERLRLREGSFHPIRAPQGMWTKAVDFTLALGNRTLHPATGEKPDEDHDHHDH